MFLCVKRPRLITGFQLSRQSQINGQAYTLLFNYRRATCAFPVSCFIDKPFYLLVFRVFFFFRVTAHDQKKNIPTFENAETRESVTLFFFTKTST